MSFWRGRQKFQHLEVVPGGTFKGYGNIDPNGRVYYVNNITGASSNGGLSWKDPFDQVETAIAASETFRQEGERAPTVTTNDYIRNTIVVQGTGTAYTAITSIPNYVNIVGLGADPRGNGSGIAKVDAAGVADCMSISSDGCRGLYMVNMQFDASSAGSFVGLDAEKLFRSRIESCVFMNQGISGIRILVGGGVVIKDVACTNDTFAQITGLTLGGGATCNAMKITDSEFHGDTQGVLFSAVAGKQTVFKDVYARGGNFGFRDTSASSVGFQPQYIRCYGYGNDSATINLAGFKIDNNYTAHAFGCIANDNGTSHHYPTRTD